MKLMVCGKGGSGKSTIASLLAKEFAKEEKKVLVIDTDESNYGLHRQLGLDLPQDFTNYFGGKQAALDSIMQSQPAFDHSFFEKKWGLDDIPQEYVSENHGVKLVAIGKIHEVGEGCACTMGIIAQQFISNLELGPDEVAITDSEAGIEHFGRNIEKDVDAILMVIDPSFESIRLSEKVHELGNSIGKPVYAVLNKVNTKNEIYMREGVSDKDGIIASVPEDSNISLTGLIGAELSFEYDEIIKMSKYLTGHLK
ncbi:MAG: adenylyl-sulfate kinase [Clostridia bacterium]|nr:adenylyl-sulfate kinase [Clostridia bacterium]